MTRAVQTFAEYLSSKDLKLTKERKAVLEELFLHTGHLEQRSWRTICARRKRAPPGLPSTGP